MRTLTILAACVLLVPVGAFAQGAGATPPQPDLRKWDAGGTIGWHNRPIENGMYHARTNSLFAGVMAGHYWTENLKTEVEFGTGGQMRSMFWDPSFSRDPYGMPAQMTGSNVQVSAGQFYQFFHNAWVHPFLGAGAVWEHGRFEATRPAQQITVYSYANGAPVPTSVAVPAFSKVWTVNRVSPFLTGGFKAYITYHAFLRGDMRIAIGNGAQTFITRAGFGIDF